ncbi:MAG TPA: glycosyltransferase family 39 protein [Phycisphaerales bacterium]|nr:glycosyltransferase family 39 protein [Phycisphaerales bacterium]
MTPAPTPQRLSARRAVYLIALVGAAIRLWGLAALPLVITDDGSGYLHWAQLLVQGQPMEINPLRTPGYPVFLAGCLIAFGDGPVGILLAQHLAGWLATFLVGLVAIRLAGPRIGAALGTLAALDPWLIGFECYLLTEALSVLGMAAAFAIACLGTRPRWAWGGLLGIVLGLTCLVRPSFQIAVPFLALGWLLHSSREPGTRGVRAAVAPALALVLAFAVTTGPWLRYNARRGVEGFARGTEVGFWSGMAWAGLLTEELELPPDVRDAHARLREGTLSVHAFLAQINGWHDAERRRLLARWVRASIAQRPADYAAGVGKALLWQLNIFPVWSGHTYNESAGYVGRVGADGTQWGQVAPNLQVTVNPERLRPLMMHGESGPPGRFFAWLRVRYVPGFPQAPLFGLAVAAGVVLLARRRFGLALILAGVGALIGIHALMVQPYSRYSLPAWIVLYAAPALLWIPRARPGGVGPEPVSSPSNPPAPHTLEAIHA